MSAGTRPSRYSLGIDLGTSSLKAVLLRPDGSVAASATRGYPIAVPRAGWAEQDPEDWWRAAREAIRDLLRQADARPEQVAALCAGGQMHGAVLLDQHGTPLRPAIIWPDQRAGDEARRAEATLEAHGLLPRLGGGVSPGFMLASLLWCRTHEPDLWARAATALLPKDYLRYRLTGVLTAEPSDGTGIPAIDLHGDTDAWRDTSDSGAPSGPGSDAQAEHVGDHDETQPTAVGVPCHRGTHRSGSAVAGSPRGRRPHRRPVWCLPALRALDLPASLFPPLIPSTAEAGAITADAAAATGLRPGTPVLCGGSDQAMAAIGAGLLAPGMLLISISTGGQIVTPLADPLPDPRHGLRTLCHALPDTYLALAATLGAGLSLRWLREDVFDDRGPGADARLMDRAAEAPPGAGGLLFLPYLAGERAPLLDPATSGAFVGLRLDHGRPHLARAVLEGIAFSLHHALEPLQEAGVRTTRAILAGGAAQHPLMRAIMADALNQPMTPLETAEQSALGAALLAAQHAGFFPTLQAACDAAVRYGTPVEPDPARAARYQDLYVQYRGLYPLLRETTHALRRHAVQASDR